MVHTGEALQPNAVGIEQVLMSGGLVLVAAVLSAGGQQALGVSGIIGLAIQLEPFADQVAARPHIPIARAVGHDLAFGQDMIGEGIGDAADDLDAIHRRAGDGIEVVVIVLNGTPARHFLAQDRIVQCVLIFDQAGDGAGTHTILAKLVELHGGRILLAGKEPQAGHRFIIHEPIPLTLDLLPALVIRLVQDERVFKGSVFRSEGGALLEIVVDDHVFIHEGGQAVGGLVLFALGKAVQRVGTQVDLVAHRATIEHHDLLVDIPRRAVLGGQLHARQDADRVGRLGKDRRSLVDPVADDRQGVGLLIQGRGAQRKILIDHLQIGDIHIQILIELGSDPDLRQNTDTFSQLEQEIPRSGTSIRAGEHIGQISQLIRDLDSGHIQAKGVIDLHGLIRVHDVIQHIIIGGGVEHIPDPGKRAIAGGDMVEVEEGFVLVIHVDRADGVQLIVGQQEHDTQGGTDAGLLIAGKHQPFEQAGLFKLRADQQIIVVERHGIAVIGRDDAQLRGDTIDRVKDIFFKSDGIGHHHVDGLGADHLAVQDQLYFRRTVVQCSEQAVGSDRTDHAVGHLPSCARRDLGCIARIADTGSGHLDGGADGQMVILGGDHRILELIGDLRGRHCHQRGADGALVAIGGTADQHRGVAALRLGGIGRRSAAVQMQGDDTASIQHDLRSLFRGGTGGEGLLTAVQDHHDDLTVGCDAHTGTGAAGGVVVAGGDSDLTVLDQDRGTAHGLGNIICVFAPLGSGADNRGAVLQDREEVGAAHAVILYTFHDQHTAGPSVGHIIEVRIDTHDGGIIGYVVGAVGIGVMLLGGSHLIRQPLHAPALGRIVVLVVGENAHIIPGDVDGSNIKRHLLIVRGQRIVDALGDTRGQSRHIRREDGVVGIFRLPAGASIPLQPVTALLEQIVRKGIACCRPQIRFILQTPVSLQHLDADVGGVCFVDGVANILPSLQATEAVVHEIGRTVAVRQGDREISFHDTAQAGIALLPLGDQIESIHVAVEVVYAESIVRIHAKAVVQDESGHLVHRARGHTAIVLAVVHKIAHVTSPTTQIGRSLGRQVCDIHGAEHVAKVHRIAIGQLEIVDHDVPQAHGIGAVGSILRLHIGGESRDLLSCKGDPVTVIVTVHTRADKIDYQFSRIIGGVFCFKSICILLQHSQSGKKRSIVRYFRLDRCCDARQSQPNAHQQC